MLEKMGLGSKYLHQMIYNKLLSFQYFTRKTKKAEVVEEVKTYLKSETSKVRNIKRAIKYTQIQLLLVVNC